jgi:hypothetical protein
MRLALNPRILVIAAAGAVIGGAAQLFAPAQDASSLVEVVSTVRGATAAQTGTAPPARSDANASIPTLTPAAAALLTRLAHRTADASAANELFASHSWYVPPPAPPPPPPSAPAEPAAPPLPFTFVGSFAPQGGEAVYFLSIGDRVYDVKPGDTVDEVYSFDAVENGTLIFTYKPLSIRQTLAVGGGV